MKRPQPQPPHRRGTFHRRLQPLYTEKHKVSSGFLPNALPFLTTSHRHHVPSSTSLPHHFPSSPLPFVTTSLRHHFPSSPLPFVTTSLRHHFPSSPLPFVTTSLRHHPVIVSSLHQGQFHRFIFFCYVLLCYVLLYDLPPFIISSLRIIFVRNTEVLLPNFLPWFCLWIFYDLFMKNMNCFMKYVCFFQWKHMFFNEHFMICFMRKDGFYLWFWYDFCLIPRVLPEPKRSKNHKIHHKFYHK